MKHWHTDFTPNDLLYSTPMWVRIPSLPVECQNHTIFQGIRNTLGGFIGEYDLTLKYTQLSMTHICVNLNLYVPLPTQITIQGGEKT